MRDRQKPKTIWGHVLMSKKMAMNSEHREWNTHKKKFARAHILTRTSALRCTKLAKKSGDHQRIAVSRASCSPYLLQLKGNASRNWKIMLKITQAWRIWSAEKPLRAIYIHDRLQLTHLYTLACTHTDTQSQTQIQCTASYERGCNQHVNGICFLDDFCGFQQQQQQITPNVSKRNATKVSASRIWAVFGFWWRYNFCPFFFVSSFLGNINGIQNDFNSSLNRIAL